jgi:hypothetical protein
VLRQVSHARPIPIIERDPADPLNEPEAIGGCHRRVAGDLAAARGGAAK